MFSVEDLKSLLSTAKDNYDIAISFDGAELLEVNGMYVDNDTHTVVLVNDPVRVLRSEEE